MLHKINALRAEHELSPLVISKALQKAAEAHNLEMTQEGYFDHVSPHKDHAYPEDRADQAGYEWTELYENIFESPQTDPQLATQEAFEAWSNSSIHKQNMLAPKARHAGLSLATSKHGKHYFTLMVGNK